MILTDREIKGSLNAGLLVIDPKPAVEAYASTSVDLTLAAPLRTFKPETTGLQTVIDPCASDYNVTRLLDSLTDRVEIDPVNGYVLQRSRLVLAWTRESV